MSFDPEWLARSKRFSHNEDWSEIQETESPDDWDLVKEYEIAET